jgi:hypothetical protein
MEAIDRSHYCNVIEAPWLVNGGHGASLRCHNMRRPSIDLRQEQAFTSRKHRTEKKRTEKLTCWPWNLGGRFRPQYFLTRTGVTQVHLSQCGPIPRWQRPAHSAPISVRRMSLVVEAQSCCAYSWAGRSAPRSNSRELTQRGVTTRHGLPIATWPGASDSNLQQLPLRLLKSKRKVIEARWVSKPLAFAGTLRPRRLNN